ETLPSGLIRVGISKERIASEIVGYDVIGITSIFTTQTNMVLDLIRFIKEVDPRKLVVAGGVNARYLANRFFESGTDVICLSEAEQAIVQIGNALRSGSRDFSGINGIAFKTPEGKIAFNNTQEVIWDLDQLPIPAWDLLPTDKYWDISRPHGGDFPPGMRIQYGSLMTSRGCPFACSYCHISKEVKGSRAGEVGDLRFKSLERVMAEIEILKNMGTEYVFLEDDSLLAKKQRAIDIFQALKGSGLRLIDVNGVNIVHLSRNDGSGRLVIDRELLEAMADSGFEKISLPFESGSQRIIDKYASRKWRTDRLDTVALIHTMRDLGITALGNYTIGYPDETFDEMMETIMLAKRHVDEGLTAASFFVIVPFPGTTLFDMALREGHLSPDFNPDDMRWTKSVFQNTPVSADTLEHVRTLAWKLINQPQFVQGKETTGFSSLVPASSS
ncbi:MAG: B12-binding domain-containing radical SAM protein, partial [Dehalococcoidia bacterium]